MSPRPQSPRETAFDEQSRDDPTRAGDEVAREAPDREASPGRRRSRYHASSRRKKQREARAPREEGPVPPQANAGDDSAPGPREDKARPSEAYKGRPGHPAESPRGWALFVTISAIVILALIFWAVFV